jgi:hypothetical protein
VEAVGEKEIKEVLTQLSNREVRFEGLTEEEVLSLSKDEVDAFIFVDGPVVFRAGTATILGNFRREGTD